MAMLSLDTTFDTIRSMQVAGAADQRAFTDTVARDAATVVNAVFELDMSSVRRHVATGILAAIR